MPHIPQHLIRAAILAQAPNPEEVKEKIPWLAKEKREYKKREHPEDDLQIACVNLLKACHILYWSTPNHIFGGRPKSPGAFMGYMAKEKAKGLRKGVSDLLIFFRNKFGVPMLCAAEIKVGYNSLTDEQSEFIAEVEKQGGMGAMVKSLDDLRALLKKAGHPMFA